MRSNFVTLAAMTLASMFVTVRANDWWYVIYNVTTMDFLDTDKGNVITTNVDSVDAVKANNDKGQRWKFRNGLNKDGYISSEAHADHMVGYDSSKDEFHADFKTSNSGSAVMAHFLNDSYITLCFDTNCIGAQGQHVDGAVPWKFEQVNQA